ncbi:MAG: YCF48-related protein [Siphonobacter sp.]
MQSIEAKREKTFQVDKVANRFLMIMLLCVLWMGCRREEEMAGAERSLTLDSLSFLETDMPRGVYCNKLLFTNDSTGFVVGNNGYLSKTTNGGKHWESLDSHTSTASLLDITFINETTGFIIGYDSERARGILLETQDGGQTWTVKKEGSDFEPQSINFPSSSVGYLLNGATSILKTQDGGNSWQSMLLPENTLATGVFFKTNQEGIVTALNGTYYVTNDGGNTWNNKQTSITDHLYQVYYVGSKTILQADSRLVEIVNGDSYKIREIHYARPICFLNEKQAIGIGLNYESTDAYSLGHIMVTNDGWASYVRRTYSNAISFKGIARMNEDKVMIIGYGSSTIVAILAL